MLEPIIDVAKNLGVLERDIELHGKWKAKISLGALRSDFPSARRAKLVLVTAMTPTPHGEGKTVTSIGLAMGLARLGHKSVVCLRQPSLGPVFGIKGGAAGGGKATVEPVQDINLGFTGDIDAVAAAHNLLCAMLDNHIFHGNELGVDPKTVAWPHALDMEDRALRQIVIGLGQKNGVPREDGFVIAAASEVMAILSLSKDYSDLKRRLACIILAYDRDGETVQAGQVRAVGAMAAVLRDALKPNLVQTSEGTPALIHGGCFGNIAHGTSSLVSILLGLQLADYCVVEAGFGSDLGAEKFVDIAARIGGFNVHSAVVVASIRALRHHGGAPNLDSGSHDMEAVKKGLENLDKHIENIRTLGLTPVVAINKFPMDTQDELGLVREFCESRNTTSALSTVFEEGGRGGIELSEQVTEATRKSLPAKPLYPLDASLEDKLDTIVRTIYGGSGVDYSMEARRDIKRMLELDHAKVPVCVAKTPLSLSDDPAKLGRPHGFRTLVRRISAAAGAGFNVAYMGDIVTMPGLPRRPAAELIDLTDDGLVTGLH